MSLSWTEVSCDACVDDTAHGGLQWQTVEESEDTDECPQQPENDTARNSTDVIEDTDDCTQQPEADTARNFAEQEPNMIVP